MAKFKILVGRFGRFEPSGHRVYKAGEVVDLNDKEVALLGDRVAPLAVHTPETPPDPPADPVEEEVFDGAGNPVKPKSKSKR